MTVNRSQIRKNSILLLIKLNFNVCLHHCHLEGFLELVAQCNLTSVIDLDTTRFDWIGLITKQSYWMGIIMQITSCVWFVCHLSCCSLFSYCGQKINCQKQNIKLLVRHLIHFVKHLQILESYGFMTINL